MDPDPLRLLETAHPVRPPALLPSSPNSRFRLRPNYRLTHPPETVNKRVNKIAKNVDGPTQISRRRARPSLYWLLRREKIRSSWQLFCSVCVTVRILEDDNEHQNEDDFSTTDFTSQQP